VQGKQDCSECWSRSQPGVVSSVLEWAEKRLDLQCLHPVVSSSVHRRQSVQPEPRLRGRPTQRDRSCGVGELRHTRPRPCLFRRRSEDRCLGGRLAVSLRLFCAIDRCFCIYSQRCCFWDGSRLGSERVSRRKDQRAGSARFSEIHPKGGDEGPKRQEGDTRGGVEP
jgi:hypothetical protein